MRLFVVAGSPPHISVSTWLMRSSAPHPPGPGLPLQAPSVQISIMSPLSLSVSQGLEIRLLGCDQAQAMLPFDCVDNIYAAYERPVTLKKRFPVPLFRLTLRAIQQALSDPHAPVLLSYKP